VKKKSGFKVKICVKKSEIEVKVSVFGLK